MTTGWPPTLGQDASAFTTPAEYIDYCYSEYEGVFYQSKPAWPIAGVRFAIKRQPVTDNRCKTFWHIVSEGTVETARTLDDDRLRCVCWSRHMIDEFARIHPAPASTRLVWWKNIRGGETRYLIALADFSYLVVVADRGTFVLLWTAYPITAAHTERKLRREYAAYWASPF